MAYGLPTRGQQDWDDEMNNSIEALKATADAALAASSTAVSTANYARDRADSVHTAVIGAPDATVAELVEDATSLTAGALSATFVAEGSAFADLGKQAGVDNTGATECAAAIQTALDGFLALGVRAYAKGTFKIASTVTINGNADLGDATFNWVGAGTGTAVQIGTATSGVYLSRARITLPAIYNLSKSAYGWAEAGVAGTTGVKAINLDACTITVPHIQNFETGLWCYGQGQGTVYSTFHLGTLYNNKVQHLLSADDTGWCNENKFRGGKMSYNSSEGSAVAGTRDIHIPVTTSLVNNNKWDAVSFEGDVAEYHVECGGLDNEWATCRWENPTGCRVKWNSPAVGNQILGGYRAELIEVTLGASAVPQNIISAARWDFANQSTGGATSTKYSVRVNYQGIHVKPVTGTVDRFFIETSTGKLWFGDGVTLTMNIGAIGSSTAGLYAGHWASGTDNTYDIGLSSSFRFRDLNLGRNAKIGGALDHDGTTVGFYGVTPATRPAAYTQTYATASRTHAALTSADAVAAPTKAEFDALRADLINTRQVLNSLIDDLQANGLLQ